MIAKISNGIGSPGKLWTGSNPSDGVIVNCHIIERQCSCGATTRKFRAKELIASKDASGALELPTVFLTMGGVGSICDGPGKEDALRAPLVCWNWSGRIGGHAVVNPVMVVNGYIRWEDLPDAKPGFVWIQTYAGSTLSEYVLVKEDHPALEMIVLEGQCPPCREKTEIEALPENLQVSVANMMEAGVSKSKVCQALGLSYGGDWGDGEKDGDIPVDKTVSARNFLKQFYQDDEARDAVGLAQGKVLSRPTARGFRARPRGRDRW